MKCSDPNLVADIPGYTKETFGVRCGNLKINPTFETPPPNKWPRCIPRTCVKYLNGTLWDVENKKTLQVCLMFIHIRLDPMVTHKVLTHKIC